jgi:hypothetical protein
MRVKHETHRTEPDAVVELFDSGSPSRHIFMEIKEGITIRSRVSAVLTVIDSEGNERPTPPLPKRTDAQKALRLCLRKEDMAEALEHFSKAGQNNWTELFKAYEAVGLCVGGNLVKLGWTNNDGAERFIKTCHHYRHHKHPLPDRPMGWGEAKHFVRALLNKALDHPWK